MICQAVRELLSRLGANLGNWADRVSGHDNTMEAPLWWFIVDQVAGRLYLLGDPR